MNSERLATLLPFAIFVGRWEELERYGWRLSARSWDAESGAWLCMFLRRERSRRPR